jgi:N,N'-diacetyllegionaminate synthase
MRYFVLAEIGINHLGEVTIAKQMIDAAEDAGADAVKFQYYVWEDIENDYPLSDPQLRAIVAKSQLSLDQLAELRDYAKSVGLGWVCTAFKRPRRIAELASLKPDAIKIRFHDFEIGFIQKALATDVPLVLASCAAPPIENMAVYYHPRCRWLYCIPKYPPAPEDFDAARSTGFHGFSDHFPNLTASLVAAALTRREDDYIIEKHVMLDPVDPKNLVPFSPEQDIYHKEGHFDKPPDYAVSITFKQLKELVKHLRLMEKLRPGKPYFPSAPRNL